MGKILLIEDEGAIKEHLREKLRHKRHEVTLANSCTSAVSCWIKNDGDFDCIILDLNINPSGLTNEETDEYFPVHGILVLDKISDVNIPRWKGKTKKEKEDEIWKKTIVYSGYIDRLKEKNKVRNYNDLIRIPKGEDTSISDLMEVVNDFFNKRG